MRKILYVCGWVLLGIAIAMASRASEVVSRDVFVGGRDGYITFRIPAMVVTRNNVVLAFCEGRKTGILDHGDIDLVLKRSFDGGKTWGRLQVIQGKGFTTWGNPAPVVDRATGAVWLLFCLDNDRVFVTSSNDDGATWASPREITQSVKPAGWGWYATGPGHGIQLVSGRLLVPCDHKEKGMASHVVYSDDHGKTWRLGGVLEPGTDESMAFEAGDGRVYLSMRNSYGKNRRAYSWSEDGGIKWAPVKLDEVLVDPNCQASILRIAGKQLSQGMVLFANPASARRESISVRVSSDDAKSWGNPTTIYSGPSAYSDLAAISDGAVGALYENGKAWPYQKITFTVLLVEKPGAGSQISP